MAGRPAGHGRVQRDRAGVLRDPANADLLGREFDDRDTTQSPPVAVVNETLARRLWPEGRWIGSTVIIDHTPREVVGVVADVSIKSRNEPAEPWIFAPYWQNPGQIDSRIAVRTAGDPAAALLPELTREVHRVDPGVPIAETITLPVRIAGLTRPVRVSGALRRLRGLARDAADGDRLYGALAFAVSRRTKEIGIRLALGAARARLVGSIVREGLTVVLPGAAMGVLLAIATSRVVSHLLYASARADWLFYAAAASSSPSWRLGRHWCRRVEPPLSIPSSRFGRSDRLAPCHVPPLCRDHLFARMRCESPNSCHK